MRNMPTRIFFSYILVEALTFYLFSRWLGVGWTILLLLGCFFGGLFLASWQMRAIAITAARARTSPGRLAGDIGLVGAGALLVALPGLFTAIVGLLFIFPPTRALVRRTMAQRVRTSVENFGVRSFQRAAAYRPTTRFGSFQEAAGDNASNSSNARSRSKEDTEVIDVDTEELSDEELARWSENLKPSDFSSLNTDAESNDTDFNAKGTTSEESNENNGSHFDDDSDRHNDKGTDSK